ncbi:MAG: proline dehydrogenase family protein, partial [Candidatus Dormibacteria bacterium]
YGMRLGASRFVAGESLDECIDAIRKLNHQGFWCNATLLGEAVQNAEEAELAEQDYEGLVNRVAKEQLRCHVSIKLTLMGLDHSQELAQANLRKLLQLSQSHGLRMRIDMEDSSHVDATLEVYRSLLQEGFQNLGAVLQASLRRTASDLASLLPLRPNLRLVKGAYLEPEAVAYPDKAEVDRNYMELMERALGSGGYTAIATHDQRMVESAITIADGLKLPRDRFEFQMLYGIRPQLQRDLWRRGYTVLVATSYGIHWYPFFMRRLAERPANVVFLLRNVVRR